MNENISSYLDKYIGYQDPQYAIMLTGVWGCGKSFFIKKWKENVALLKGKKYNPLYISLYGLSSVNDVRESINRQLHPILTSSLAKGAKHAALAIANATLKCNLGNESKPVEVDYQLDFLPLFQSGNKEIETTGKILIFDDLERCLINRVELLGFLNFFVEHCGCKVILICNERKMLIPSGKKVICKENCGENLERWIAENDDNKVEDKEYRDFKEKTVGVTFEVMPEINSAIEAFIKEIANDPRELLNDMKPYLKQMLEKTNNNNLRVLRQCLFDFDSIVKQLPCESYKSKLYIPVMRKLLLDLLITSIELKLGNPVFDNMEDFDHDFLPSDKNHSLLSLVKFYSDIPNQLDIQILDFESVADVLIYVKTGIYPIEKIISDLGENEKEKQPWDKLIYFWNLSNKEFVDNYKLADKKIRSHEVSVDELVNITFRLVNFDNIGIMPARKALKSDVRYCVKKHIAGMSTLDELVRYKKGVLRRFNYYCFNQEVALWNDVRSVIISTIDERISCSPSEMSNILENLNSSSVCEFQKKINSDDPITGRSYSMASIFDKVNPQKVVSGIVALSNQERVIFADSLGAHYECLQTSNYHEHKYYERERENVLTIVQLLKNKRLTKIDKYSVGLIVKQFEMLLNI